MHNNTVVYIPATLPSAGSRTGTKRHPDTQFVVCQLIMYPQEVFSQNVWLKGMEALTLDNVVFDLASLPLIRVKTQIPLFNPLY
ncbi:MAG: hypothetical protein V8S21_11910 [Lachnospira eligens]